ncbi:hypothetical protein EGW08_002258 [Elysia chlorotica]|uniref:G-protein coupled receptors family 1 profile domain-containing protein n=1 Tax=Elysia chlorotica TaxID=188477 RepID=A0A433U844_ELYCH|nr:hypothetical protein EGW08_002258 [Elysia chlorotica]
MERSDRRMNQTLGLRKLAGEYIKTCCEEGWEDGPSRSGMETSVWKKPSCVASDAQVRKVARRKPPSDTARAASWYLAARAVSDGGFLLATFLTWASDATQLGFFHTEVLCQCLVFFPFLFGFLSVWLTVIVTVENYIRICKPFTVQKFCNVPIAKRAILGLTIMGLLLYNYPLWTTKVFVQAGYDNMTHVWCQSDHGFAEIMRWLTFWDMLITLVIPSIVIIVLMAAITCSLISSLKRQSRLSAGSRLQPAGAPPRASSRSNSSPQAKVTRMLFAVSFFFIVLNGPSHIIRMKMAVLDLLGRVQTQAPSVEEKLQVIFQIMYYSSFAVNLVIYLIFGDNFRRQFVQTYLWPCLGLCGKRRSNRPGGGGCGAFSEMTALSTVRLEEMDARPDEQAALLDTPARGQGTPQGNQGKTGTVGPNHGVSELPGPQGTAVYMGQPDGNRNNGGVGGSSPYRHQENGYTDLADNKDETDVQAHVYGNDVYQGDDYSALTSSNV